MSYGTPLAITLPTIDGVATEAQAATRINDCFTAIKSRLEGKVLPASMDISSDLSFLSGAVYSGAKDLQRVNWASLSAALASASYPYTAFVLNGDLYFNDGSGNQIRITASGAVNIASAGGITGAGYGTGVPTVEINWDSVNNKYKFYGTGVSPDHYAALECDDVLLRDASGNSIRLGAPAGMSADYTALLPGAVPGTNNVLVMTTAGTISHSTNPASLTLASGGHMTISGSGRYKHGTFTKLISGAAGISGSLNASFESVQQGVWDFSATPSRVTYPVPLDAGHRLLSVVVHGNFSTADTKTITLRSLNPATGTDSILETLTSTSATGWAARTFNFGDVTLAAGFTYSVRVEIGNPADQLAGIEITYDYP